MTWLSGYQQGIFPRLVAEYFPYGSLTNSYWIKHPPRQNQVRYHGVLAPHSRHKAAVKTLVPRPPESAKLEVQAGATHKISSGQEHTEEKKPSSSYRLLWAELLTRTFQTELIACPRCEGKLKLIALVKKPSAIKKICRHLGLPTELPPLAPARDPPQSSFADWY